MVDDRPVVYRLGRTSFLYALLFFLFLLNDFSFFVIFTSTFQVVSLPLIPSLGLFPRKRIGRNDQILLSLAIQTELSAFFGD